MLNTSYGKASIKYTTVLPKGCIDELKDLTDKKIIPSVSQGIRLAVENFVAIQKRRAYESLICEAATDKAFIKRTMDMQNDFAAVDAEGEYEW